MGSSGPTAAPLSMTSIVPSILAADFDRLGEALDVVQALGLPAIHIDVMDGHFQPHISVGQPVVRSIRKATKLKLDVHLMIERPERYIEDFINAGADYVAFHPEATHDVTFGINSAKRRGVKVGLALGPATPVERCYEILEDLDYVLVQTGTVDKGTETFKQRSINKVAALAKARETRRLSLTIEAEGGIGIGEARELLPAGADILVVGSAIFDTQERGEAMRAFVRGLGHDRGAFGQKMNARVH